MEQLDTLEKAIDLFRSGDRAAASRILAQQVTQEPHNDSAWLWLAASLEQPDQQVYCLRKAQAIDPHNPGTLEELNDYLGLSRSIREEGSPINLPPPEVPVVPEPEPEATTDQVKVVKPVKKGMTQVQVIILVVMVLAILVVVAGLAYLFLSSNGMPSFLQSILGLGNLILLLP